jgi:hypothetical protein
MSIQNAGDYMTHGPPIGNGYILIARKLLKSFLMESPPLRLKLWMWMLLSARFRDGDKLKRGQLLTTIEEMREAMAYYTGFRKQRPTKDEIRCAYGAFMKAAMITTTRTTRGIIITVCNYNKYQRSKSYGSHGEPNDDDMAKPTVTPHDTEGMKEQREKGEEGDPIPKSPPIRIEYPEWLNRPLWSEFLNHRKSVGKPIKSPKAENLNLNRLRALIDQGFSQEEIINLAIEKGWQSLYPPKDQNRGASKASRRLQNNLNESAKAYQILFGENDGSN